MFQDICSDVDFKFWLRKKKFKRTLKFRFDLGYDLNLVHFVNKLFHW